ncbi:hypothetical protein OH76DRAFT_308389 [Lentinus brumalis]|uniref:Uncharacterized protein n=1 Tax=Lentinus brumalis TaxID=2498619 RepID=A0A371CKA5_9APHY|nr:hypothetical protein OH76DRAFT_308389 [Polyporus brumalis]
MKRSANLLAQLLSSACLRRSRTRIPCLPATPRVFCTCTLVWGASINRVTADEMNVENMLRLSRKHAYRGKRSSTKTGRHSFLLCSPHGPFNSRNLMSPGWQPEKKRLVWAGVPRTSVLKGVLSLKGVSILVMLPVSG